MRQVTQSLKDGSISVVEAPPPSLQPRGALVRTAYSLISSGTESAKVELGRQGLIGKARSRPDMARQVIDKARRDGVLSTYRTVRARLEEAGALGYSAAGVVSDVGELVQGLRAGDRVACGGAGYANHADVLYVPQNLCARVPDDLDLADAAYATVGAIAMQGVRLSGVTLGDRVAVIGLGLVGQLVAQIALAAGCEVAGIDIESAKCDLASRLGAHGTHAGGGPGAAEWCAEFTRGLGFDGVLIAAGTKSSDPIRLAGEIARDRGTVVVVGDVGMTIPRAPYYERELSLRVSRSYGPGRYDPSYEEEGLDYPYGYVRWTERRNMEEFLRLLASRRVQVAPLTTHRFEVERASEAYAALRDRDARPVGVLLEYTGGVESPPLISVPAKSRPVRGTAPGSPGRRRVGLALIGAGNFATATLLPALRADARVDLRAVLTAGGLSARDVAERCGFAACASDLDALLADEDTHGVLIVTRHDTHADYAIRALEAGKTVFVEKPLVLTEPELDRVVEAWRNAPGDLVVGFNRRFSPLTTEVASAIANRAGPVTVVCRVNAGSIPASHWIQNLETGGGRIVGEMCHFVDLACFLARSRPVEVFAAGLGNAKSAASQDTLCATIRFADGSLASIDYVATGDTRFPKERVEVYSTGRVYLIDDFRALVTVKGGRRQRRVTRQDKGHANEMRSFVDLVAGDPTEVITFEDCVASTAATFKIVESLASGRPVDVTMPAG